MATEAPFHVLNPSSPRRGDVKKYFKEMPPSNFCWVERSSHPTHLETIVEWAVVSGKKEIIVWAGDGSLNRVVQRLYELNALEKAAVGIVPVGTCNDFARYLGLRNWNDAAKAIQLPKRSFERFDLGLVQLDGSKRIFVNNSGFGRSRRATEVHRPSGLKDIYSFETKKVQVEWNTGATHEYEVLRVYLAVVHNAPYFGKGKYFDSGISPRDGRLSTYIVPPFSKTKLIWKLLGSYFGRPMSDRHMKRIESESVTFESDLPIFPQVDGEPMGVKTNKVTFSILPAALKVVTSERQKSEN